MAVGIFCAECHNGAYSTVAAGATTNVKGSSATVAYSGHRIAADNFNAAWNVALAYLRWDAMGETRLKSQQVEARR